MRGRTGVGPQKGGQDESVTHLFEEGESGERVPRGIARAEEGGDADRLLQRTLLKRSLTGASGMDALA